MNNTIQIDIVPVSISVVTYVNSVEESKNTISIDKIQIEKDVRIVLNTSASVCVTRYSGTTRYDSRMMTMTGTDYDNYGTDDTYINTWVLSQFGYTAA